jgi:hypothetical protein
MLDGLLDRYGLWLLHASWHSMAWLQMLDWQAGTCIRLNLTLMLTFSLDPSV